MSVAIKPKGLVNLGNTCYFNSVMQVLLNAPFFGPLLEERTSSSDNKYTLEDPNSEEPIELELPECDYTVKSLADLYRLYLNQKPANSQPIAPSKLINCIRQKTGRFHRLVQEDSHELLRSLIDIIRSDEIRRQKAAIASLSENKTNPIKADIFTLIDMIFCGYFLSSVKCQKCKYNSQILEPFYDISLAINDPISHIRAAIANFTSNAILDGDNKFICERCSKNNGAKTYEAGIKSTKIAVPPNILTLHLKRFEASGGIEIRGLGGGRKNSGKKTNHGRKNRSKNKGNDDDNDADQFACARGGANFRKINKHVEFTEFLDLSDYTSELCYDLTKINKWPRLESGDPIWYALFGVVCHSGNLRGGHYTAYVKCEETDDSEFVEFIAKTPYLYQMADIDKIREHIRRCEATDRYRGDGLSNCTSEKPTSIPGSWYHISDSQVRKTTLSSVLASEAYILFYRRVIELE